MIIRSRFIWGDENIETEQEEKNVYDITILYQEDEINIDCHDNKFKEIGGNGYYRDIKNYTNWLIDKGFNNIEII